MATPIRHFMTASPISDHAGAAALLDDLPSGRWLSADHGYNANLRRVAARYDKVRTIVVPAACLAPRP